MDETNINYIGWGIIGTPKGRQQVGQGISAQLNTAKTFDLAQEFGGCLPNPKNDPESAVLYCLTLKTVGKYEILGLAEYRSIFEQGQTRAGTYFGSFIETVNSAFTPNTALFNTLFKLSSFQYENFIDSSTKSYKESIVGKEITTPKNELLQVAAELRTMPTQFLSTAEQTGTLFVSCTQEQLLETLQHLCEFQLYRQYKQIFFSTSQSISNKMKDLKITYWQAETLFSNRQLLPSYQKEISLIQGKLGQYQQKEKQMNNEMQRLKAEQQHLVNQQIEQYKQQFQHQLNQAQLEAESARNEMKQSKILSGITTELLNIISNNAEKLGNVELSRFAQPNKSNEELKQLNTQISALSSQITGLQREVHREPEIIVQKSDFMTWIFAGLSLLLLLFSIWGWADNLFGEETVSKTEHQKLLKELKLENMELKSSKVNTRLPQDNSQVENLKKEKENLKKQYEELICEANKALNAPETKVRGKYFTDLPSGVSCEKN